MVDLQISQDARRPIYRRIAEAVREAVAAGELEPGQKLPAQTALAKHFGVNPLTVGRSYELLESMGVVVQRQGSGTYLELNALDRALNSAGRRLGTIRLVCGADSLAAIARENAFIMTDVVDAMREALGQRETHIAITKSLDAECIEGIRKDDAVVLLAPGGRDMHLAFIGALQQRHIPAVSLWEHYASPIIPRVQYDRAQAAGLACRHLLDCGYRRIGFIGVRSYRGAPLSPKFYVFTCMLNEHGLDVRADYVRDVSIAPGKAYAAMRDIIERGDVPEAFFIDTDYKAMEAICALNDAGIRVPEDVGIISYDDIPEAARHTPPLTTVHVPRREIGRHCIQMLLNWPEDGSQPDSVTLTSELIVRGSTRAAGAASSTQP